MRPPCVTSVKMYAHAGNCSFAGSESESRYRGGSRFWILSVRVSIVDSERDCSRRRSRTFRFTAREDPNMPRTARRSDARFGERYPRSGAKVAHLRRLGVLILAVDTTVSSVIAVVEEISSRSMNIISGVITGR